MTITIEAGHPSKNYWSDLWRYRELFQVLAWRDISVRYKQTVIGVTWALLRPLLSMVVFTIVFGKLAKLESDFSSPYALIVFCGMLPWMFFSTGLSDAANSLVANSNLVSKVYFPRIIVPVAGVSVAFIDFLISFAILGALMAWFQYLPSWRLIFLPLFILLTFLAALGPSLWCSAQIIKYRDFRFVVPFVVQFGMYISPVGFVSTIVPEKWRLLYSLNPLVGIIDGFRWCILHEAQLDSVSVLVSVVITCIGLLVGIRKFRSTEQQFADYI